MPSSEGARPLDRLRPGRPAPESPFIPGHTRPSGPSRSLIRPGRGPGPRPTADRRQRGVVRPATEPTRPTPEAAFGYRTSLRSRRLSETSEPQGAGVSDMRRQVSWAIRASGWVTGGLVGCLTLPDPLPTNTRSTAAGGGRSPPLRTPPKRCSISGVVRGFLQSDKLQRPGGDRSTTLPVSCRNSSPQRGWATELQAATPRGPPERVARKKTGTSPNQPGGWAICAVIRWLEPVCAATASEQPSVRRAPLSRSGPDLPVPEPRGRPARSRPGPIGRPARRDRPRSGPVRIRRSHRAAAPRRPPDATAAPSRRSGSGRPAPRGRSRGRRPRPPGGIPGEDARATAVGGRPGRRSPPRALSYSPVCPTPKTPLCGNFHHLSKDKQHNQLRQAMPRSARSGLDKKGVWVYN
jgi:hypothetical protein